MCQLFSGRVKKRYVQHYSKRQKRTRTKIKCDAIINCVRLASYNTKQAQAAGRIRASATYGHPFGRTVFVFASAKKHVSSYVSLVRVDR
jgi:hypothetical protein